MQRHLMPLPKQKRYIQSLAVGQYLFSQPKESSPKAIAL
jgi:hypothetical protein